MPPRSAEPNFLNGAIWNVRKFFAYKARRSFISTYTTHYFFINYSASVFAATSIILTSARIAVSHIILVRT